MWDKPEHCKAAATSRPLRVAYLVDLADCPHALLDNVFAEAYSRWGGRRTAIVPAKANGIDERYAKWLFNLDPDIIYSFVDLEDATVEEIHERLAPSVLIRHNASGRTSVDRIRPPLQAISSLSVVPAFLARPALLTPLQDRVQIVDSHFTHGEHPFVQENFGTCSSSFGTDLTYRNADIFAPLTLISRDGLSDGHLRRDPNAIYVHEERDVVEALGEARRPLVTLSSLSDIYAPYLSGDFDFDGLTIVAGDTTEDRLAFWNGIHRKRRTDPYSVVQLRVPEAAFSDSEFIKALRRMISRRGAYGSSGRNDAIVLESTSIPSRDLDALAEMLRKADVWLSVRTRKLEDAADVIPTFRRDSDARFTTGGAFEEPEAKASAIFQGQYLSVPFTLPWHLQEALPPPTIRSGSWMVDLTIEREVDHSRYSNVRQVWAFPRRLRLDRAFELHVEAKQLWRQEEAYVRPTRTGQLAFAADLDQRSVDLTLPKSDLSAIRIGIQNDFEWRPFDRTRKKPPLGRLRFAASALSDKGRYLLGILQLFEDSRSAFSVLMNSFWREEIQRFGAELVERNPDLVKRIGTTIRNRLGQRSGALHLESDAEMQRLGEIALRVAGELRSSIPKRSYSQISDHWRVTTDQWLATHSRTSSEATEEEGAAEERSYRDPRKYLDPSIEYLCEREVLFQGYEWRCEACFNRNWVGIAALSRDMKCDVCGSIRAAFVSEEWHFRPNAFLIDAYRFHGAEAVVWALWKLFEEARSSFYFAPSLKLWKDYPSDDNPSWDAEIDAVAILDGQVFAIEATRSKGLTDGELEKLSLIAERIRPDVMMVACTAKTDSAAQTLHKRLAARMPRGVDARVDVFRPDSLDFYPGMIP